MVGKMVDRFTDGPLSPQGAQTKGSCAWYAFRRTAGCVPGPFDTSVDVPTEVARVIRATCVGPTRRSRLSNAIAAGFPALEAAPGPSAADPEAGSLHRSQTGQGAPARG